jgi:hypothetical protein
MLFRSGVLAATPGTAASLAAVRCASVPGEIETRSRDALDVL